MASDGDNGPGGTQDHTPPPPPPGSGSFHQGAIVGRKKFPTAFGTNEGNDPNAVGNRIGATVGSRRCEHSREHHIPSRLLLLCFHAPSKFEKEQRSAVPPTQIDSRRNPRTKKLIVRTTRRTSLTKLHSIGGRSYTAGVPLLSWKH